MALFPCSLHGGRYRGPAAHVYPALLIGSQSERTHLRLCPECYAHLADQTLATMVRADEQDSGQELAEPRCTTCGEHVEPSGGAVFLTQYPDGSEREDWFGVCHTQEPCLGTTRKALGLDKGDLKR